MNYRQQQQQQPTERGAKMEMITLDFIKKYGIKEDSVDDRILKFLQEHDDSPSFAMVSADETAVLILASLDGEAWVAVNRCGEVIGTASECTNYAGASLLKDVMEECEFGNYKLYALSKRATIRLD
jgi:hypothetical protein